MSIINALREYLSEYDGLEMVLTDVTLSPRSYAITQSAGGTIKKDILGNKTYQNSYIFLAKEHGGDEIDRRDNYDFLESFCAWLEDRNDQKDLPQLSPPFTSEALEVSNILLMDVDKSGEATYQVQIQFIYRKNNEVKNKWLT